MTEVRPKGKVRKVTVSLSPRAVEAARADMADRGVPTLSAYLDGLVIERAEEADLRAVLDQMLGDQPLTPDELARAEAAFRA